MHARYKQTLRVTLIGRDVQLECRGCGLVLTQPARDPIAERCPRCWRRWR